MSTRDAEMAVLLAAIRKLDKKVEWREKRRAQDQADIDRLMDERSDLALRYRDLNIADTDNDSPPDDGTDPWSTT